MLAFDSFLFLGSWLLDLIILASPSPFLYFFKFRFPLFSLFPAWCSFQMAKSKRKLTSRGKAITRSSVPDDHLYARSIVLAVQAPSAGLPSSSSTFLHPAPPPPACALDPAVLPPLPAVSPHPLESVTVQDCSSAEDLEEALLEEEQLDFSFSDEDGDDTPLLSPSAGLSGVRPPPSAVVEDCAPLTTDVAGTSLASSPGSRVWKDLFSAGKQSAPCTKLQNFSLNHLTKSYVISPEDIQPQFDVWNLCVVGYVSSKSPGFRALNGLISSVWKCASTLSIHDSGWLVFRFNSEEAKLSVLHGGPYLVYGKPLILRPMTRFFDFSTKEMSKVPIWVRFPSLPLCCWSPPCLSKIASVLGKPIQSDHMTSSLARLSYARVLVEVDLREVLQHSVVVSLPDGSPLHQHVVYEALPKFCNFCNVLGHNRLLCPKAAASSVEGVVAPEQPVHGKKGSVFGRLGPQLMPSPAGVQEHNPSLDPAPPVALLARAPKATAKAPNSSEGWTTVGPRRKSPKHNQGNSKGKEVLEDAIEPHIPSPALPVCPIVNGSLGAVTSVGEDEASGTNPTTDTPLKDLATGHRKSWSTNPGSRKASTPPLGAG